MLSRVVRRVPRTRAFSWWTVPPDVKQEHNRVQRFLNHIESSQHVSKSEVYNELLLINQELKTKELELKVEMARSGPSMARTIASGLLRLLGVLVGGYFVVQIMKNGMGQGIGTDSDLFKDNFQEYHPQSKLGARPAPEQEEWKKEENISFDSVLFSDVMGNADAKEELSDIVDYLRHPDKYEKIGLKIPKGVLLSGPPGTGKTLLARALAGEAEVPFINVNGSSFVQMFAGLGAQRVRRLFARARELAPCIVFIDEIDALGGNRDQIYNYSRQTLNQLLGEMDGFASNPGVIVVGATNLAHTLDPALVRPGRFDRTVEITLPDKKIRRQILEHYLKKTGSDGIDLDLLAANTTGFSGAELFNMVNRAGIETVKRGLNKISLATLLDAQETLVMGRASKDTVVSPLAKEITAYHEAGHALVALYTKSANPIYKATILPRGPALGFVAQNHKDEHLMSKESMMAELDVCMGGRAAEELVFGPNKVTQGASSDFRQATKTARNMVAKFGMSSEIGRVFLDENMVKHHAAVHQEVKRLTDAAYERALDLLKKKSAQHKLLAEALLKEETLTVEQIKQIVRFKEEDTCVAS